MQDFQKIYSTWSDDEISTFGGLYDDAAYAQSQRQPNGIYQTFTATLRRHNPLMILPLVAAVMCLLTMIAPMKLRDLPMDIRLLAGLGVIIFMVLALMAYLRNKIDVTLLEGKDGILKLEMTIRGGTETYCFPFDCSFYTGMVQVDQGIEHPVLICHITDANGKQLVIKELLTVLQSCPPFWPDVLSQPTVPKGVTYLVVLKGNRPILQRLKKIVDGLKV
jgi:hypothetical protein